MRLLIINGPNLNLLGSREPDIYGSQTFEDFFETLKGLFPEHELVYFQSNWEGELIDRIQKDGYDADGIVLNAGGYSHTSVAMADAISAVASPIVEVHISNTFAREVFRHRDVLAPRCVGLIAGLGLDGYRLALEFLIRHKN